jgi:hypothetical protein
MNDDGFHTLFACLDRTLTVESVKLAIVTFNLSYYCAESEEETKEEKVTKDSSRKGMLTACARGSKLCFLK